MDIKKIKAIIELLEGSDIAEIEITEEGQTLKIVTTKSHNNLHNINSNLSNHNANINQAMNHMNHNIHVQTSAGINPHASNTHIHHAEGHIIHNDTNVNQANIEQSNTSNSATVSNAVVDETKYLKSPMVGTFYRAASPGAAQFVELGDKVSANQVVCIIEAMKLMNQIESDRDGIIVDILVQDGAPVEFGQPLFIIE